MEFYLNGRKFETQFWDFLDRLTIEEKNYYSKNFQEYD